MARLARFDFYYMAVEVDCHKLGILVDHHAHGAIHDAELVVVLRLNYFVVEMDCGSLIILHRLQFPLRAVSSGVGAVERYSAHVCPADPCVWA